MSRPESTLSHDGTDAAPGGPQPLAGDMVARAELDRMLRLFTTQIESALTESQQAVESTVVSLTALMTAANAAQQGRDGTPSADALRRVNDQAKAAIRNLQFYDRLSQRLTHVRYSLSTLAEFLRTEADARDSAESWYLLQEGLRRLYRTPEEIAVFTEVLDRPPPKGASLRTTGSGDFELL